MALWSLQLFPDHLDVGQSGVFAHVKGLHHAVDGDHLAGQGDVEDLHGPALGDGEEVTAVLAQLAVQGRPVGDLRPDALPADHQAAHPVLRQIVVDLLHVIVKGPFGNAKYLKQVGGGQALFRIQQTAQDIGLSAL